MIVEVICALRQGGTQCVGEAVCSRDTFQTIEERPQVREIVRHVREHRPFEKEFVNEVSNHVYSFCVKSSPCSLL